MTLTFVDSVPKRNTRNSKLDRDENCLQGLIARFVNSSGNIARVDVSRYESYASVMSFYTSIRRAVERSAKKVRVVKRGDEIYLVKD